MNEITKLYENAGIRYFDINACKIDETGKNGKHNIYKYPPFTAEKQLKVLKVLAYDDERYISFGFDYGIWKINCHTEGQDAIRARCESFEEAVALLINEQWLYFTDAEKQEIKEILQ